MSNVLSLFIQFNSIQIQPLLQFHLLTLLLLCVLNNNRHRIMIPDNWVPPCGNRCTQKYAALTKLPWRVFCKKGCNSDEETYEECLEDCNQICYKDPVIEGQKWSAYIDRSPGSASYSEECFRACASGCGFKFEIKEEEVDKACPNRPSYSPPDQKPDPPQQPTKQPTAKPGSSA